MTPIIVEIDMALDLAYACDPEYQRLLGAVDSGMIDQQEWMDAGHALAAYLDEATAQWTAEAVAIGAREGYEVTVVDHRRSTGCQQTVTDKVDGVSAEHRIWEAAHDLMSRS